MPTSPRAASRRRSQARKLSALRQFYKFLYAEGLRADDPTGTLDSPRKDRSLPKIMSEAETGRLLDRAAEEARSRGSPTPRHAALRLHALVELLYATGLRVSELVSLPVSVALRDDRFFVVRGKGNKERMVPLSEKARHGDARLAGASASATRRWPTAPGCFRPLRTAATCRARSSRAT